MLKLDSSKSILFHFIALVYVFSAGKYSYFDGASNSSSRIGTFNEKINEKQVIRIVSTSG